MSMSALSEIAMEDIEGFRTCYPKIWHLGVLDILRLRNLRKWQKQEGHCDIPYSY